MNKDLAKHQFKKGDPRTKEAASKGGKAAQASLAKKRARREVIDVIMDHDLTPEQRKEVEALLGKLSDDEASVFVLMAAGMIKAAIDGNVSAFQTLIELADGGTVGEQGEDALSQSLRELGEEL